MRVDLAKSDMQLFHGIPASPGISVGQLCFVDRTALAVDVYTVDAGSVDNEIERLRSAIAETVTGLEKTKLKLLEDGGADHLFFIDTHLMIMSDSRLFSEPAAIIKKTHINAEGALRQTLQSYREFFEGIDDPYLSERINDVEVVVEKILRTMTGRLYAPISTKAENTIIVAHHLTPSDILQIDKNLVVGIITEDGSRTSHTVILARALQIPLLAGVENIFNLMYEGSSAILDGIEGVLTVNPDNNAFKDYLHRKDRYESFEREILEVASLPSVTPDGYYVKLRGNVEASFESPLLLRYGGEGVGLYRTEILFMNRSDMPDEQEQYLAYSAMQKAVAPHSLTIRTLDAGGDKLLDAILCSDEDNPAMGMRAIRLALSMPDEFKKQLRAILRTAADGDVRILFPMISGLEELRSAKLLLAEAAEELRLAGIAFNQKMKIGIMIEVPSAVIISDLLAKEVDFFSVGTNDLIQYSIAIDRSNEQLAFMYQPLHPAILRSLCTIVDSAHTAGIPACICGEMAGDPLFLPVLLGLGFDELSMSSLSIPRVKKILRSITREQALIITEKCLTFSTAAEIESFLKNQLVNLVGEGCL